MMKIMRVFLVLCLTAATSVQAAASDLMVLIPCGTVSISTNTARPGYFGAAVMTTSIETVEGSYRLVATDKVASDLIESLTSGQEVAVFGKFVKPSSSGKPTRNYDGSYDIEPSSVHGANCSR